MPRSDAVRQEALERDGYRCVLCGLDGRDESQRGMLQVHHVDPLGMGGSDELDVVENAITLCFDCHAEVHAASKKIVRWEPDILEVMDIERHKIDHAKLWFYRRRLAEELEPIEARVQGLHRIDGDVAKDVWRLCVGDAWRSLDPDSRSFKEYAGARAWDIGKAVRLAKLWSQGVEHDVQWEPGMTEMEFRRKLRSVVGEEDRSYFYLRMDVAVLREWIAERQARIVRCTDDDAAMEMCVGFKVGKVVGLRAKDGTITDMDGIEIPIEVKGQVA